MLKENFKKSESVITKDVLINTLMKFGLSSNEIKDYFHFEEMGAYKEQETMLYCKRKSILNEIHNTENTLSELDYLINEAREKQKKETLK